MGRFTRVPSPQQVAARSRATVPGMTEAILQPLYDYTTYAAAGQSSLNFFQTPIGAGGKTIADTNMDLAGALPNGKTFLVQAIEVAFFPGVSPGTLGAPAAPSFAQDVYAFMKSGHIQFYYSSKSYLDEAPIGALGQSFGIDMSAAMSDSTTAGAGQQVTAQYAQLHRALYKINPVELAPQQNFKVTMNWPIAVALPSGQNARVGVRLRGIMYRAAQ